MRHPFELYLTLKFLRRVERKELIALKKEAKHRDGETDKKERVLGLGANENGFNVVIREKRKIPVQSKDIKKRKDFKNIKNCVKTRGPKTTPPPPQNKPPPPPREFHY